MSKRLQVLLDEAEYNEIQNLAKENGMTTAEWVRQALRTAKRDYPRARTAKKMAALAASTTYSFPTANIDQMLGEIEQGYGGDIR